MDERAIDLAWAAGLLEGEGSIRIAEIAKRDKRWRWFILALECTMTDRSCIDELRRLFGGSITMQRKKPPHRDAYRWYVSAQIAGAAIRELIPFLRSERWRGRAALAVEFQAQKRRGAARHIEGYSDLQRDYYERMKKLNVRGR